VRKESCLRKKDGKEIPVLASLSFLKDTTGRPVYAIFTLKDITHQKEKEKQLLFLATHDHLTGLPNRFLFNDRLKLALDQARRNKRKLALMILDIDNFKDINDNFGHSVGDELLKAFGERLRGILRKTDTVARMGGDEFLILLPDIKTPQSAERAAQKIMEEGKKPFFLGRRKIEVSFSIGISIYPEDGEDVDKLTTSADVALFIVKKRGKSNFAWYTSAVEKLNPGQI
ncbi:sensor domain-containing diguanylate cyclase, partial [Candidatus Aerophobetes bacterium]|nr:sensor domain-containing diguanylate cyclase [Candidatus Aerophobetes bacterium]